MTVDDTPEYRIEYQIQRQLPGQDDFTEVGFGSSGGWGSIDAALFSLESYVSRGQWETTEGMPDPEEMFE